jgi:uncharacterized protein (TIGR03083 family)
MPMRPVEPIFTADLFPALHQELMSVLRGLTDEDWNRPTAAGRWTVKDVVAHLLDGNVRQISFRRDQLAPLPPDHPIDSYADLVRFIDDINAVWVKACQRVSPRLLLEFHELTGPEAADVFARLDPFAPALFGVAWAGEMSSTNWFDTAREYTERWHHQQQIREAVGAEGLTSRKWLHPVLDTFMRALPHTYRDLEVENGTLVAFDISGEAGGSWTLGRGEAGWTLHSGRSADAAGRVETDQDTAWRMMTKGLGLELAGSRISVHGPDRLASPFIGMLAIMG